MRLRDTSPPPVWKGIVVSGSSPAGALVIGEGVVVIQVPYDPVLEVFDGHKYTSDEGESVGFTVSIADEKGLNPSAA